MARPEAGIFATALYEELAPMAWDDEAQGWALLIYLDTIGQMFDEIEDLARDEEDGTPGWTKLLDIDRTPGKALPWLAQFIGAILAPTLSETEQRDYIRAAANWKRGTRQTIVDTTKFFLTGSKNVRIDERDSSPYHYTITIDPSEVGDLATVQAALLAQKPAGLQFTLNLTTTKTYFQNKTDYPTYALAKAAKPTYLDRRGS